MFSYIINLLSYIRKSTLRFILHGFGFLSRINLPFIGKSSFVNRKPTDVESSNLATPQRALQYPKPTPTRYIPRISMVWIYFFDSHSHIGWARVLGPAMEMKKLDVRQEPTHGPKKTVRKYARAFSGPRLVAHEGRIIKHLPLLYIDVDRCRIEGSGSRGSRTVP